MNVSEIIMTLLAEKQSEVLTLRQQLDTALHERDEAMRILSEQTQPRDEPADEHL